MPHFYTKADSNEEGKTVLDRKKLQYLISSYTIIFQSKILRLWKSENEIEQENYTGRMMIEIFDNRAVCIFI